MKTPKIVLHNKPLKTVENFVYLGFSIDASLSLDVEISRRIGKATTAFMNLTDRLTGRTVNYGREPRPECTKHVYYQPFSTGVNHGRPTLPRKRD